MLVTLAEHIPCMFITIKLYRTKEHAMHVSNTGHIPCTCALDMCIVLFVRLFVCVVVRLLEWGRAQMVRMNAVEMGGNAWVGRC